MLYRLNGETYLELDREILTFMVFAIHASKSLGANAKLRAELGNVCATLECEIQRLPASDPNMDLVS